jgi:hypothetical protein
LTGLFAHQAVLKDAFYQEWLKFKFLLVNTGDEKIRDGKLSISGVLVPAFYRNNPVNLKTNKTIE